MGPAGHQSSFKRVPAPSVIEKTLNRPVVMESFLTLPNIDPNMVIRQVEGTDQCPLHTSRTLKLHLMPNVGRRGGNVGLFSLLLLLPVVVKLTVVVKL